MLTDHHIELITKLGFHQDQIIGMGMQALVLDAGAEIVKIYPRTGAALPDLARLRAFYDSLESSEASFSVPSIREIDRREDAIVVREAKLRGKTLDARALNALSASQIGIYLAGYVDTLFAVRRIKTAYLEEGELASAIFDALNPRFGGWHELLRGHIDYKRKIDQAFLPVDVSDWNGKLKTLEQLFNGRYTGEVALIHGDFFPGNVMVDDDLNVTALVDFGTMTMRGDPLWDVITGWAFIDMYHEVERYDLKAMVMERIKERLSDADLSLGYAYLMVFSLITSNLYAPNDRDGHYWWCVGNLNHEQMWAGIRRLV